MTIQNRLVVTNSTMHFVPQAERTGLALCLSGGGYGAALFHSGAVRRLHELDVLDRIDAISSVSGGSIFAAFLAIRLQTLVGLYEEAIPVLAIPHVQRVNTEFGRHSVPFF